jgi:predicted porin
MEQYVAYGDSDQTISGDYDGIDSKQDTEVTFLPSITLDNGLRFGANVQLEANTGGDQIDESYMFIKGSFGEVLLGSENSAGYKMSYGAPDVTFVNVSSGSMSSFIPFTGADDVFRATLGTTFLENAGNNDAQRFTYFTPRFSGFQLGASYARDANQDDNTQVDADTELHDIFDVGANYVNSFGDFDIALSGRYGIASGASGDDDPEVWGVGLNLGFAGFTVGGAYAEQDEAGTTDGEAYELGASYTTGPWGFSVTWMHGENVGNGDGTKDHVLDEDTGIIDPPTFVAEFGDEELDQYLVGLSYALAKGVKLNAFGAYVDFDDASGGIEETDFDGFVIGTGIKISF